VDFFFRFTLSFIDFFIDFCVPNLKKKSITYHFFTKQIFRFKVYSFIFVRIGPLILH
jgi:hypothetical protein